MGQGEHPTDLELVAWAERELAAADASVVGAHIETCPTCRHLVADLQPPLPQPSFEPEATVSVLPGALIEALAAERVADPAAGQLWQLEWDGRGAVGLITDVDTDTVHVVPAEDDLHLGDAHALLLEEAASPVGLAFVLWTGLATAVPLRVLNVLLGVVPAPVMTGVRAALAAVAADQSGATSGVGAAIDGVLDERAQLAAGIAERFAELAAATWLPAGSSAPVDVGELLRARGLQATQVAEHLGLSPREVLKLVRGQRPLAPEETGPLATLLGVAPSELGATVSIPAGLAAALDRPQRRPRLRALARAASVSEAGFRWREALAVLPMAARQPRVPGVRPDWEALVEDRLHAH